MAGRTIQKKITSGQRAPMLWLLIGSVKGNYLDLGAAYGWSQTGVGRFFVARAAETTCTSAALLAANASSVVCQSWPATGTDPLHAGGLDECLRDTPGAFARDAPFGAATTLCCARGQHFRLDTGDPSARWPSETARRFVSSEVDGPVAGPFDQIGVHPDRSNSDRVGGDHSGNSNSNGSGGGGGELSCFKPAHGYGGLRRALAGLVRVGTVTVLGAHFGSGREGSSSGGSSWVDPLSHDESETGEVVDVLIGSRAVTIPGVVAAGAIPLSSSIGQGRQVQWTVLYASRARDLGLVRAIDVLLTKPPHGFARWSFDRSVSAATRTAGAMPAAYAAAAAKQGLENFSANSSDDALNWGLFHDSFVDRTAAPFVIDCKQIANSSYVQPFKLPWRAPAAWAEAKRGSAVATDMGEEVGEIPIDREAVLREAGGCTAPARATHGSSPVAVPPLGAAQFSARGMYGEAAAVAAAAEAGTASAAATAAASPGLVHQVRWEQDGEKRLLRLDRGVWGKADFVESLWFNASGRFRITPGDGQRAAGAAARAEASYRCRWETADGCGYDCLMDRIGASQLELMGRWRVRDERLDAFGGAVPEPLLVLVDSATGLLRGLHELGAGAASFLWAPATTATATAAVTPTAPRSLVLDKVVRGSPAASRFALPLACSGTPEAGGSQHLLSTHDEADGAVGDGGYGNSASPPLLHRESWWHAHLSELVGYFAATNIALLQVPQLFKTVHARSAGGLSWGTIALNTSNGLLWLGYGFALSQVPIIIANTMYCLANALLIGCKWVYDGGRGAAAATTTIKMAKTPDAASLEEGSGSSGRSSVELSAGARTGVAAAL